jgi:hypothetical protein
MKKRIFPHLAVGRMYVLRCFDTAHLEAKRHVGMPPWRFTRVVRRGIDGQTRRSLTFGLPP